MPRIFSFSALLILLVLCGPSRAASVPSGFNDRQIAAGLASPTALTVLPDGRVLIVQQGGRIRIVRNDTLLPADFYVVGNADNFAERGCLGIAADPDFLANHHVYLYCTVTIGSRSHNRILRVTEANDTVLPGSETVILDLPDIPPGTEWHMGGALRFGVDGKLYIAVGGHENLRVAPEVSHSQNLANPFGKILRINADGSVPPDNPFTGTPGADPTIYNYGLRNPFAFDIQPGTGLMYINDVGAGSIEEINQGIAGANYGWPAHEGAASDPQYTDAVFEYPHGVGCAITGGVFYNPEMPQFPAAYSGKYFFTDFCSGNMWWIDPADPTSSTLFASGLDSAVNLAVAPDGALYYLSRNQNADPSTNGGTLNKIVFTNSDAPRITRNLQNAAVFLGDAVTFSVTADNAGSYQWRRNGVDIPGATGPSYTIARTTMADNQAAFSVVIRNAAGDVLSNTAVLTVSSNRLPVPVITSPAEGARFAPGDRIRYAGTATDAEDGTLPASAFTWQISFMHDVHSHPFIAPTSGKTGDEFTMPDFESEAANTWFRVTLTVTDSDGQTASVTRDVYPREQLSEMTPAGAAAGIQRDRNGNGGRMRLGQIPYAKGLGVVVPHEMTFALNGNCNGRFISDVGIDDAAGKQGSVTFRVYLDNQLAFDSGIMRGGDPRQTINIPVAGKNSLRLVVTDAGDGNASDLADWAGARVTGCPASDTSPLKPPVGKSSSGGGCSIGGDGSFDPVLPALTVLALAMLSWRRRRF